MNGRFQPGAHLQVQRPPLYYHHGIYISDDRVIQFGSGITLQNKSSTAISAISLADFEDGGTAEVVRHGYESWFTGHHPATDEHWKVIERAEFLLKLQPKLKYHLIGRNCEVIANMYASGSWNESYQVRRFFTFRTAMDLALMLGISGRVRAKLPILNSVVVLLVAGALASIGVKVTYDDQIRELWNEIRDDWQAHERMLAGDPRNGPTGSSS